VVEQAQTSVAMGQGDVGRSASGHRTVRDAAFDVMRRFGLTTIFGNPGSTEIHFLTDLPSDIDFVLGLHEGSVVGMATGYAIARGEPAFVNLHTAAGLGNAINAIANARDARAPLVVVVGQQDRRQVAFEPFLTGRHLDRLAGEYPVWTNLALRAQDVPGAIARAYHEAQAAKGPALLVVPMGDWQEPADELAAGTPDRVLRPRSVAPGEVAELAALIADAESAAAPAFHRTTPCLPAICRGAAGWSARPLPRTTSCSPSGRTRFVSTYLTSQARPWRPELTLP
jgi:benzoylformate decarboxylase